MAFTKYANVSLLTVGVADFDSGSRRLAFRDSAREASHYRTNANNLDIAELINIVADEYKISRDPSDYIYEAVRAVTAEVPNENGDAFPRGELLRFDHKLGRRVFETFVAKPHHINHKTDNPKTARGVVLDAYYNETADVKPSCPSCGNDTSKTAGRDESGIHCNKCGSVVKDEFVELLLAVDSKKDPVFARGVKAGSLNSLSMGCLAAHTDCSICGNRATSVAQFCEHIKSGNKKKMFKTASGEKMSFEKCGGVVFTEISRVDQPADPTAKQRELLNFPTLESETKALILSAKIANIVNKYARSPELVPSGISESTRDDAAEALYQLIVSLSESAAGAPDAETQRELAMWQKALSLLQDLDSGFTLRDPAPDQKFPVPTKDAAGGIDVVGLKSELDEYSKSNPKMEQFAQFIKGVLPQGGDSADGGSIADYLKEKKESDTRPRSMEEMGVMDESGKSSPVTETTTAVPMDVKGNKILDSIFEDFNRLLKGSNVSTNFSDAYRKVKVAVTKAGNVRVATGRGNLMVIRPATKPSNKDEAKKVAMEVVNHIAANGLTATAIAYNAIIGPKAAQVLEHHIEDFAGGREGGDDMGASEGGHLDMKDMERGQGEDPTAEENTDMQEGHEQRDQGNSSVSGKGESEMTDHEEVSQGPAKDVLDREDSDMRDGRPSAPGSTLDDKHMDYKAKKSTKTAQSDMPPAADEPKSEETPPSDDLSVDEMPMPGQVDDGANAQLAEAAANYLNTSDSQSMSLDALEELAAATAKASGKSAEMGKCSSTPETCAKDLEKMLDEKMESIQNGTISPAEIEELQALVQMCLEVAGQSAPMESGEAELPEPEYMPDEEKAAALKKKASRLERLYKSRFERVRAEATTKLANIEKAAFDKLAAKFNRALKLAAKRQELNLEYSPIKASMLDVLASKLDLDAETFYPGMDEYTATKIVEAATQTALSEFTDVLMKRASEFMAMSDEALTAIESDVDNLRPVQITASVAHTAYEDENLVRDAAVKGNMIVAPSSSEFNIPKAAARDNIRSALSDTKIKRTSATLKK